MDIPRTPVGPLPIHLKNGQEVKVNDHVYCSPPWAVRDGTPYSIARIMEFLKPEGKEGSDGDNYHFTRVRLAWYYRPSDVSDRSVSDSRLLLAAIYSEVCDINQLRAKCHVVHRDKISDLAGWKKRPDRFYFNRLFDPYIKKEFEIIQSTDVRNLPDNIKENLVDKYEYLVAEKEFIPELTDSIRRCRTCSSWCPSSDSVRCDRCKHYFHMRCVQPPLAAKPSRGYGWTCAPCARDHEEAVTAQHIRHSSPPPSKTKSNAPTPRGRGRPRKDRSQAEKEENLPVRHFRLWPFRYFGQFTVAEDTLDDEDLIFPRAPVRQGAKFQSSLPDLNGAASDEERGGDSTVEVLSIINILTESEAAEVEECKQALCEEGPSHSVDWLTEVIRRFSVAAMAARPLASINMQHSTRTEPWKTHPTRYTDKEWSKEEITTFEEAIQAHGAELRSVRDEVVTRTMPEVVRFYGHWKSSKVGEENKQLREHGPLAEPEYTQYGEHDKRQQVGLDDEDSSVYNQAASKPPSCGACRTRDSKQWWKAPKGLPTNFLCDGCGTNWRKYADLNVRPLREESVLPSLKHKVMEREKREGSPLMGPSAKRARTSISQPPSPAASSTAPHIRCEACLKYGPVGKVLKCKKCEFKVHAGSCGALVDPTDAESWLCDICQNEETLEASVLPECLLCPRLRHGSTTQKIVGPMPDSFLRACKPTEAQGWAHVICSVFMQDLLFTDSTRLKAVEGVSMLAQYRWAARCYLCLSTEGAVTRCNDCNHEFHVSCAWNHGYKFGFEIQPVKSSRRDSTVTVTFKGETGCMNAIISCKEHDHSRRVIYEICETNDGGETALAVYSRAYKQVTVGSTHALLRKAKRLDNLLNIRPETTPFTLPVEVNLDCHRCRTQFTPAFYPHEGRWLCHQCYIRADDYVVVNGHGHGHANGVNGINGHGHGHGHEAAEDGLALGAGTLVAVGSA